MASRDGSQSEGEAECNKRRGRTTATSRFMRCKSQQSSPKPSSSSPGTTRLARECACLHSKVDAQAQSSACRLRRTGRSATTEHRKCKRKCECVCVETRGPHRVLDRSNPMDGEGDGLAVRVRVNRLVFFFSLCSYLMKIHGQKKKRRMRKTYTTYTTAAQTTPQMQR